MSNRRTDDTRTYVAHQGAEVLALHAIPVGAILRTKVNAAMRRNAPDPIGCVLLAQLAVDAAMQGRGLGRTMMLHAMRQAPKVADISGCRLFTTHPARPELVPYCRRFGLSLVDATPLLMAMPISKVRALLQALA